MADQNVPQGRRPHYHRGRRGQDRRGGERRSAQHPQETYGSRDQADVEQIMREIRARVSQRHGIELSNQQIQELAARRLDAILEPRNVKPALLAQLRRSAGEPVELAPAVTNGADTFDETTLYSSGSGLIRAIRRLLRPILKLFFDPQPIADVLHAQARLNAEATARDAARDTTQAEWNALHYEILQRLVTEVSRVSLEMQALSMRVEALGAKVDFNERRVRSFEQNFQQVRPVTTRSTESGAQAAGSTPAAPAAPAAADGIPADSGSDERRRRRRRRRGRRGGAGPSEAAPATSDAAANTQEPEEFEEGDDGEPGNADASAVTAAEPEPVVSHEPAIAVSPLQPTEPQTAAVPSAPEAAAPPAASELPTQPAPPKDEPAPPAPIDHADQGPQDR